MSSTIEIVPLTPSGYVESATINLTFYPKQHSGQEITRFETSPKAEQNSNVLQFQWKKPEGEISFKVDAQVMTTNSIVQIKKKIPFPIQSLPNEIIFYTNPSPTIDSDNPKIIRAASDIVEGEDDLYFAVFRLADWTKRNIKYNLSTLTAEISQKASWVLDNKQGVCDELTSLFIAMARSVGIPARFISGIAYTNSELFSESWGAHGWAEVYIPGYGWVPFDITYGEFGWINPTHLKFKESVDSDEPSTYYQWLGRNADLKAGELDIKTSLVRHSGSYNVPISLNARLLKKSVAIGSYNLIEAEIENPNPFYYATEVYVNEPKEIALIGDEIKGILLEPFEKRKVFWIIKVSDTLNKKYSYTFPVIVRTINNISSETSFVSSIKEEYFNIDEMEQRKSLFEEEKQKKYSANVMLQCSPTKQEFYEYQDAKIACEAKNNGNVFISGADICFENSCIKTDIGISQSKNFSFDVAKSNTGYKEIPVTLKNSIVSKSSFVNFTIKDAPKIEIKNIQYPENVSYNQNFTISFDVSRKSDSLPKSAVLKVTRNSIATEWGLGKFEYSARKFDLHLIGKDLNYGSNYFEIEVVYYDDNGKKYTENKSFSIGIWDVSILQRILLTMNTYQNKEWVTPSIIIGAIAFIVLILLLFRKK
jgi:transglutaminase-like putative cysteine protease